MITNRGDYLKKILKLNLCILNMVILIISLTGCNNSNANETSMEEKVNTEIAYIDSELVSIVNKLNNINYAKYKVEVKKVQDESEKSESQQGEGGSNEQSSEGSGNSEQQGGSQDSKEKNKSSSEINKSFSMVTDNILGKEKQINWDDLKSKIENLYSTWTVVSMDLKKEGISSEQLDNFSNSIDNLAVSVKNEDEFATMDNVINLYSFLPQFVKTYGSDKDTNLIYSKYNLLVCYKYAVLEDWEQLKNSVEDLKMSFSNVLNKKEEYTGKEINIESATVIIGEMENSDEVKDKDVFFVKYKNLMEELNIILSV